jgi:hypothetical protein
LSHSASPWSLCSEPSVFFLLLGPAFLTLPLSHPHADWPTALISLSWISQSPHAYTSPFVPRGRGVLFYLPPWPVSGAWQRLNTPWLDEWISALNSSLLGSSKQPRHKATIAMAVSCLVSYNWSRASAGWESFKSWGHCGCPRQGQEMAPGHLLSFSNHPGGKVCLGGTHLGNSWWDVCLFAVPTSRAYFWSRYWIRACVIPAVTLPSMG